MPFNSFPKKESPALMTWLLCSTALAFLPSVANANPQGGQVAGGSATITQSGPQLTVKQTSQKAIINWQSFSIGTGETATFNQPSTSSIALNRVTGVDPSTILGSLDANGQVWLINPNGIAFGKSARVDVAGLLATTEDIADRDFMAGNYQFASLANPGAMVTNAGHITIRDAGLAALVAPGVENSGVIEADLGQIQLSSTAAFTVDLYGDGTFNFALTKQVSQAIKKPDGTTPAAAVTNSGKLIANGGKILLTANAAKSVVDNVINMTGYAQATTAKVSANGEITLDGGDGGSVQVAGALDASGKATGQTGGTVQVTGNDVTVAQTAKIDVSGGAGGGTALIGGDLHGGGTLRHAQTTTIASGATISADALRSGNGGKVVVWSDNQTNFAGMISAKGGSQSGNGGTAEVSSHGVLAFTGIANLLAPYGQAGTLLLDPENVTIAATGDTPSLPSSGPITLAADEDDSVLSVSTLQSALAVADVTVSTGSTGSQAGDITVTAPINWSGANSLTLSAYRNIAVDAPIINTANADVVLHSDNTGTGIGTVSFGTGDTISTSGTVSLFYDPSVNPAGSGVNPSSYVNPTEDYSGDVSGVATLATYMLVNSVSDLQDIQNNLTGSYALGRDIDASTTATWNSGAGFAPLGPFSGTLEGQGHTIDQLTIDSGQSLVGMVGNNNGTIRDFSLTNISVIATSSASINVGGVAAINAGSGSIIGVNVSGTVSSTGSDFEHVGGLAGLNTGSITDSNVSATVAAGTGGNNNGQYTFGGLVGSNLGTISDSSSSGAVSGGSGDGGGLAGYSTDVITQSYATGDVTSPNALVGGLVGWNQGGTIEASYATGSVDGGTGPAGGLVELDDEGGVITDSYSTGPVSGTTTGGLVDRFGYAGGTVTDSYWNTLTSGQSTSAGGTGLTTSQLKTSLPTGFDPTVWTIVPGTNTGYPSLLWQSAVSPTSSGTTVGFGVPTTPTPTPTPAPTPTPTPVPSPTPTPTPTPSPVPTPTPTPQPTPSPTPTPTPTPTPQPTPSPTPTPTPVPTPTPTPVPSPTPTPTPTPTPVPTPTPPSSNAAIAAELAQIQAQVNALQVAVNQTVGAQASGAAAPPVLPVAGSQPYVSMPLNTSTATAPPITASSFNVSVTTPQQSGTLFNSLTQMPAANPFQSDIQNGVSNIQQDVKELVAIGAAGLTFGYVGAEATDEVIQYKDAYDSLNQIANGQVSDGVKNLVISNVVEQPLLDSTGLKGVPGAGQVLDIPTQAVIILGTVSTAAEVSAINGIGNVVGTGLYDSYSALTNFFGGGK